ncbi:unnamed protein product [Camellia sinensis]
MCDLDLYITPIRVISIPELVPDCIMHATVHCSTRFNFHIFLPNFDFFAELR